MEAKEETAAGLLANWKKIRSASDKGIGICKECGWTGLMFGFNVCLRCDKRWMLEPMTEETAPASVIARRLDEMTEDAGIRIHRGKFKYNGFCKRGTVVSTVGNAVLGFGLQVPASEQQAIQEWLLIKEELKNKE